MGIRDVRYAITVLGMHRSGTSALAGMLARLGCDVPKDLLDAAPMNAKGFYESRSLSEMNDELLRSAGSSWFTWQEFNKDWLRSAKAAEFRDLALSNLQSAYKDSRLPLLKDPRLCLIVDFWEDVFVVAGYEPRYILTHRHPLEVAQSLNYWAGYDPAYGQLLWLRYVLEAEVATRGKMRYFTSYNLLMTDWSQIAKRSSEVLDLAWPRLSDRVSGEIAEFLDYDLQHMRAGASHHTGGLHATPWVAEVFEILERWAANGEDSKDWAIFDNIRAQFNRAAPVFSGAVENGRRDSLRLQVKEQEEKQLIMKLEATQNKLEASLSECRELLSKHECLQVESAEMRLLVEKRQDEGGALRVSLDDLNAKNAHLVARLQEKQDEVDRALALIAKFEKDTKDLQGEKAELEKVIVERDRSLRDLRLEAVRNEADLRDEFTAALRKNREHVDAALVEIRNLKSSATRRLSKSLGRILNRS